tara:strand:+ start:1320 stop:2018 length:699 start_codon:yes stop_codon:yes gene_type:complete
MKIKIIVFLVIVLVLNSCVATFKVGSKTYSNNSSMRVANAVNNVWLDAYSSRYNINNPYWVECAMHGEHNLAVFDISYNPQFCRPFNSFSVWNSRGNDIWWSNYGRYNRYNPLLSGYRYYGLGGRWNPFSNPYQYNGFIPYHGWNHYYNGFGRNVYYGRRANNVNGRWETTRPTRRINTPTRIRTTPTPIRTRTNTTPIPRVRNNTPIRNTPVIRNTRPIRKKTSRPVRKGN